LTRWAIYPLQPKNRQWPKSIEPIPGSIGWPPAIKNKLASSWLAKPNLSFLSKMNLNDKFFAAARSQLA